MTSAALHSQNPAAADLSAERLAAANINPVSGLATDYLNHFNEPAMLLQMVADCPDLAEEILTWEPRSYAEHFEHTGFRDKELAIAAYEAADPLVRLAFHRACAAVEVALRDAQHRLSGGSEDLGFAAPHADLVFELIAEVTGVIHGTAADPTAADQAAIDALFS